MELRYYQRASIDSLYTYFQTNIGNPVVVLPTGTGKSLVLSGFINEAIQAWPETRIVVATHVAELVEQDYLEYVTLSPFANAGLYSAGLGRRDTKNQTLFVGIQSVYNKAHKIGHVDLLMVDEAQTIPQEGDGMWRKFIAALLEINPYMKVVGLTATDYRMSSGLITTGENRIFTDVCYEYPLLQAIKDGYLCPIIPSNMATRYDIESLGAGKEYTEKELDRVFNIDGLTSAALDEVEAFGKDRKSWLIFGASNAHAKAIHAELQRRGYKGACVTQDTPPAERDQAAKDIKSGSIRYLVNNKIFTTGFNCKSIDLIADFGKTKSPGLHVQKLGRGTRCIGANIHESIENGKADCLLLDFARNVDFHGALDQIRGRDKTKGSGEAPMKICPGLLPDKIPCGEVLFAGIRICFNCGHEFPMDSELDIRTSGGSAAVLSTQIEPEWHHVVAMDVALHRKRGAPDAPPTMRVTYLTLGGRFSEYICFEHSGYAHKKAVSWWRKCGIAALMPRTVESAIEFNYPVPTRISVLPDGKYWRIVDRDFSAPPDEVLIHNGEEYYEIPW